MNGKTFSAQQQKRTQKGLLIKNNWKSFSFSTFVRSQKQQKQQKKVKSFCLRDNDAKKLFEAAIFLELN